jgi:integrase
MQFDAREAKQLAPGAHIIMDDYPGLRLKATVTGKAWIYRYKSLVDAKMRQIKIGAWPAMSFPAAVVKWEELKSQRDTGKDPASEKRAGRAAEKAAVVEAKEEARLEALTVGKVCAAYHSGYIKAHRKPKGVAEVAQLFRSMLGDLEHVPAVNVTRSVAFDFLEGLMERPVQGARVRRELGAAWDYALDAGRLPEDTPNWWRLVMKGRFKSKGKKIEGVHVGTRKRVLSESELAQLLPWLPNFAKTITDALTMYLWTAQRGAEIVNMRGSEVTEEKDGLWWTIPKDKTKNERFEEASDQRVPLVGRAEQVIRRRIELFGDGDLFPGQKERTGRAIKQSTITTAVWYHQPYSGAHPDRPRPRLPVTHWSPHDLRRTSRTLLASIGCPEEIAEAILGHMKGGVVGVYNLHGYDKERRLWITRLASRLEAIAAGGGLPIS